MREKKTGQCKSCKPFFRHSVIPSFRYSVIPLFRYSVIPPPAIPSFRHSAIPSFRYSVIPSFFDALRGRASGDGTGLNGWDSVFFKKLAFLFSYLGGVVYHTRNLSCQVCQRQRRRRGKGLQDEKCEKEFSGYGYGGRAGGRTPACAYHSNVIARSIATKQPSRSLRVYA